MNTDFILLNKITIFTLYIHPYDYHYYTPPLPDAAGETEIKRERIIKRERERESEREREWTE